MPAKPSSFLDLMALHEELTEAFLHHQEALLALDIDGALRELFLGEHRKMRDHDLRERNILYPQLDRVTSKEERARLLEECIHG